MLRLRRALVADSGLINNQASNANLRYCFQIANSPVLRGRRMLATASLRDDHKNLSRLERQRLRRPVSPHLTIYKWQYQSLTSILQRFSGIFLSGSLYVFAAGHLLAPIVLPDFAHVFDIDTIAAAVRDLPAWLKLSGKFALVLPFTYHALNGVKHLIWDLGLGLANKKLIGRWAWLVAGCSVVSACGLTVY